MEPVSHNTMKLLLGLPLFVCFLCWTDGTKSPIIGILTQELSIKSILRPQYSSYISASYVKSVEAAGARVVPILINQTKEYYRDLLFSVNGALFPGGSASFRIKHGYADAARMIFQLAKKINNLGGYFPIMSICLGFELLFYLETGKDYRVACTSLENVGLPLQFAYGYRNSTLFGSAPSKIIKILKKKPVTPNFHKKCLPPSIMKKNGMENWKLLSISRGEPNTTFISSMESIIHPFVGIQFHPERNVYDWSEKFTHLKTPDGLQTQRFFYDWLIKAARKNYHKFSEPENEKKNLIFNFPSMHGSTAGYTYDEIYIFK